MSTQPATIAEVANSSQASKAVFQAFADRQRQRSTTDLNRLYIKVSATDKTVSEQEFLSVFRTLEEIGVGHLIIGRKNNPNRFKWRYNLREMAKAAYSDEKVTVSSLVPLPQTLKRQAVKGKRGRPKGFSPKKVVKTPVETPKQEVSLAPVLQFSIQLPANTSPSEIKAFLELAKSLQK